MKIIPWDNKYLNDMAEIHAELFAEEGKSWDTQTSSDHLQKDFLDAPEYCFMAINDNQECVGCISCRLDPFYTSKMLMIDNLIVRRKDQNNGVAGELLKTIVDLARKNNIPKIHMLVDTRNKFPLSWYEEIGFDRSGWIELEQFTENIKI